MKINRIFIGYDHRQPVTYNVAHYSLMTTAKNPISITPLIIDQLPIDRQGLTPFTYTRFLVPYLCDYEGWALFVDADVLATRDIGELFALADDKYSVMVAKDKAKFEWAAVMLFNCAKCKQLTPEYVSTAERLHTIAWAKDEEIGCIPGEWNFLVGYEEKPESIPGLIHYTQGVPAYPETKHCDYSSTWNNVFRDMSTHEPWKALMGQSVHSVNINNEHILPKYLFDLENKRPKPEYEGAVRELVG